MGDALVSRRWFAINLTRRLRRRPKARFTEVVTIRDRADVPQRLNPRRVYQLGEPAKWVMLECPCGRGHVLELNLAHPGRPKWRLRTNDGKEPSLSPSVDFRGERRCHFWLREGRVRWD